MKKSLLLKTSNDPSLHYQVNKKCSFKECDNADSKTKRQICSSRHQNLDESMNEFTLENHFRLCHGPLNARVLKPEHCRRFLLGEFDVVAVFGTFALGSTENIDDVCSSGESKSELLIVLQKISPLCLKMHLSPCLPHNLSFPAKNSP